MKNIYYLLRQEYYDQRKRAAVFGGVIFLIFFISRFVEELANRYGRMGSTDYQDAIGTYLFAAGCIFISVTFVRSMHSKAGQHAWLMLPVHSHEKLIAKILAHSVIYPVALVLFMFLSTLVTEGTMWLIWRHTVPLLNPVSFDVLEMIAHYVVISSFFLMGASYFKSAHMIKSLLSILLFIFSLGLVAVIAVRIGYSSHFDLMMAGDFHVDENLILTQFNHEKLARIAEIIGKTIYWAVLAPLFWTVTYFRIREKEAKDAV